MMPGHIVKRPLAIAALAAGTLLLSDAAFAQDAVNLTDHEPTEQELIEALTPPMRTRGIRPVARENDVREEATQAVDLSVQFEYDSSVLTEATKQTLSTLAGALSSDSLSSFNFMIEGHTDASGPDDYNMGLSQRRAQSVVDYLTSQLGVSPSQLSSVGKGEHELLDAANPRSGVNRRVRIRNMGSS